VSEGRPTSRLILPLLLAGLALILAGLAVGIVTTALFVRDAFPDAVKPIQEFDEGVLTTIEARDKPYPLVLSLVVDELDDPVPPIDVTLRTPGGDAIPTEKSSGWASIMGRNYQRVLEITPPDQGPFEILADAEGEDSTADFVITYNPDNVMRAESARSKPWWLVSGLMLAGGIAALVAAAILRASQPRSIDGLV